MRRAVVERGQQENQVTVYMCTNTAVETQDPIIADDMQESTKHALWAIGSSGLESDLLWISSSMLLPVKVAYLD